jgi:SRSO17 transposase
VRRARAAGLTLTAVVADAEYGDNRTVRQALHRLRLPYALGISPTLTVFRGTPTLRIDRAQAPPRNRRDGWPDQEPVSVRALSEALPARAWHRVSWRNGTNPPWEADFAATPRHAGDRLAPAAPRPRNLAPVRTRPRPDRAPQTRYWASIGSAEPAQSSPWSQG